MNRPQKIPPKQTDLQVQISPSKLESKNDKIKQDINQSTTNNLNFNSNINIMKRQKSFKCEDISNNEKILDSKKLNSNNLNITNTDNNQINQIVNNTSENINAQNILNKSNSGNELSAMEKHRLKMKERRSIDKQIKLENGTYDKLESKDHKLNEDINSILGYDQ